MFPPNDRPAKTVDVLDVSMNSAADVAAAGHPAPNPEEST